MTRTKPIPWEINPEKQAKIGNIIVVDPASVISGIVYMSRTGEVLKTRTIVNDQYSNWGSKFKTIMTEAGMFFGKEAMNCTHLVYEKTNSMIGSSLAQVLALAPFIMALPRLRVQSGTWDTAVYAPSWKAFAKSHGCTTPVKGMKSLSEISDIEVDSDDVADAILIGWAFLAKWGLFDERLLKR